MSPPPATTTLSLAGLRVLDDPVERSRFTRFLPTEPSADHSGPQAQQAESWLQIGGMHCAACAGLVEQALAAVPGVLSAQVSSAGQRAQVRWQPALTQVSTLVAAVQAAGYQAVPDTQQAARALRTAESRLLLWRLFVASFCAMQVMMLATPSYVAAVGELAPDLRQLLNLSAWTLSLPVLLFSSAPFFGGAWRALRQGRIGMDLPVALGIAVCFITSTGAAFQPDGLFGHEVVFDSLTMFVSFLLIGRYLETRSRHAACDRLEQALGQLPQTARRLRDDGSIEEISLLRLAIGDRVQVPVGEVFPADGRLISGRTRVDEALLSGESHPLPRAAGEAVVGGSLNLGAPVTMQVDRVGADTRFEAIVALVRGALSQRPAMARTADRWAGPFLWAVLLLAAGAALAWQFIDPARAVWVAVSVLIVTCPCALSLAAPSALLSAAGALGRHGVLLRRIDALETLARVDHLFLDKTGTLTNSRPAWCGSHGLDRPGARGQTVSALETDAAALAAWSSHPLSQALCEAFPEATAQAGRWQQVQETAGAGLSARDDQGREWRLGSAAWLGLAEAGPGAGEHHNTQRLQVFFGQPGQAALALRFDERLRNNTQAALAALREDGVKLTLLSGDRPERVQQLAQRLHLSAAVGAASPEDKLAAVRAAQARGECVAMVGDGINDAPVLAQADVSFAMGQGAVVARVHADAVLLSDQLMDLVFARQLARRTLRVIRQNLAWAALYNACCVPLAMVGLMPPWAAGMGMALSSVLVVANASRLAR